MIYTSNLQIPKSETNTSATIAETSATAISVFNTGIQLVEQYFSGYYTFNISTNTDVSIATEANIIEIKDTGTILTTNRYLNITSRPVKLLRIIKNSTLFALTFGAVTIPSSKIFIIYDNNIISCYGKTSISDIFTYISGLPDTSKVVMIKKVTGNSILVSGKGKAAVAATSNLTMDIWLNTTKVGTIKFSAGSTLGIVSVFGTVYISPIDNIYIKTQSIQDATLANVGIVLNIIGE